MHCEHKPGECLHFINSTNKKSNNLCTPSRQNGDNFRSIVSLNDLCKLDMNFNTSCSHENYYIFMKPITLNIPLTIIFFLNCIDTLNIYKKI